MKYKSILAMVCTTMVISLVGCTTTTRTRVRQYEYTDQQPSQHDRKHQSEYEMVSPGKMTSPGHMVSPAEPPR